MPDPHTTSSRTIRLRVAGGILIGLGVGHPLLLAVTKGGPTMLGWVRRGLWSTVSLDLRPDSAPPPAVVESRLTYWAGIGSFAVPMALLGGLTWHFAKRHVRIPAWTGWTLAGWCGLAGVILVPSPWPLGAVAGVLIATAGQPAEPARLVERALS